MGNSKGPIGGFKSYEKAKEFVGKLGLNSLNDWYKYIKTNYFLSDLPKDPQGYYKRQGIDFSWGDFLGTGNKGPKDYNFVLYEEAKKFAINLKLKSQKEWYEYTKIDGFPLQIPKDPQGYYKRQGVDFSWGDFLGTGTIASQNRKYISYEEAKKIVYTLGLNSKNDWHEYTKTNSFTSDIPKNPAGAYKNKGWISWGDFLGTGNKGPNDYVFKSYEEAKKFLVDFNLKSSKYWQSYTKSRFFPSDLPKDPQDYYTKQGVDFSWGDFLGTGKIANQNRKYTSYEEAKKLIHTLKLKSEANWRDYTKKSEFPLNIPKSPRGVYKNNGWISWGDFLGTGNRGKKHYISYEDAKKLVHTLNLKSIKEWDYYKKTSDFPLYIPQHVDIFYKNNGWISWGDFLGTGTLAPKDRIYISYEEAKKLIHTLKLKSETEWKEFIKREDFPLNIPKNPRGVYKNKGFISMGDFLGTGKIANQNCKYISYEDAKKFVHILELKSGKEWYEYTKASDFPLQIPKNSEQYYKKQNIWISWADFLGTDNHGFKEIRKNKLNLINTLEDSDLLYMDPFELLTIIGQGNLPQEFDVLVNSEAGSEERTLTLEELKRSFEQQEDTEDEEKIEIVDQQNNDTNKQGEEIIQQDEVDEIITSQTQQEVINKSLPELRILDDLHSIDREIYSSMDEEAFECLIQYKLRKLWNDVINKQIDVENYKKETGEKYFEKIKQMFFEEYDYVIDYKPKNGYKHEHTPSLMQCLVVKRLLTQKNYGNWSGTGAGKTLSFILAARELNSRLTLVIAFNSTISNTKNEILKAYPDSKVYTHYKKGQIFDRNYHNYLILNYEKFQQDYSENIFISLVDNNIIDFVVIDEVHNIKQRVDDSESKRRYVLNKLIQTARRNNENLHTLVMSATPVVNNIQEAKSLLQLLTGNEYDDLETRSTIPNAIKMFQQLTIHGLRYKPKYNISIEERTGLNCSNLRIDGSSLMDKIVDISSRDYIQLEKLLFDLKLKSIDQYLKKGVVIYSYFTEGFIQKIVDYVKYKGYSCEIYTGENPELRDGNLNKFIAGDIDIIIGSKPIGTGVDGLQHVCDRMILLTLPWTSSEYEQLKGRIYRQGSKFGSVDIVIPQVTIDTNEGSWSWDVQRLNLIKNKKTLSDAVVDGIIPSKRLPTLETMCQRAQESLKSWKERMEAGDVVVFTRREVNVQDLYPNGYDVDTVQTTIKSEISEFNRIGKITNSKKMNEILSKNPDSWFRYHALRSVRMKDWQEIPFEIIAQKIKSKDHVVVDFGCGDNKMKDFLKNNKVYSFDHIAIDDSVIACDMRDISEYLGNESVDVCVFSLSLWGPNYLEYIKEAYRVMKYNSIIHIAEPAKSYDEQQLKDFKKELQDIGFTIISHENRGKFIYLTGIKI